MDVKNAYEFLGEYAGWIIRKKARQFVGRYGFAKLDIKDLEQELAIDLRLRLSKYDRTKAKQNTFITRIVNNKIATMIEARKTAKRDYRLNAGSLNDAIKDEAGNATERLEHVDEVACRRRAGWLRSTPEDMQDLAIDFERVFSSLPPELREICERLKTQKIIEISRATGTSRSAIYNARKKLYTIFEDAGLGDYL